MIVRNESKLSLPSKGRLDSIKSLPTGDFARWAGLSLLFLAVAVVQTWPLLINITDSIADSKNAPLPDTYAFLWNLSWVKQAIVDLQTNPYETDYIFFPDGEHLYLHPLAFVNGVLSIPLQVTTGNLIFSWNVLALLFFVFSGLATYAIAYRITRNNLASILAGFILPLGQSRFLSCSLFDSSIQGVCGRRPLRPYAGRSCFTTIRNSPSTPLSSSCFSFCIGESCSSGAKTMSSCESS